MVLTNIFTAFDYAETPKSFTSDDLFFFESATYPCDEVSFARRRVIQESLGDQARGCPRSQHKVALKNGEVETCDRVVLSSFFSFQFS